MNRRMTLTNRHISGFFIFSGLRTSIGTSSFQDSCFTGQNLFNAGHFYCSTGQSRDSAHSTGQARSKIRALRDRIFSMRDTFIAVRDNLGTAHTQRDKHVPRFVLCGTESFQCGTLLLQYGTPSGQRTLNGTSSFQDSCFTGQNLFNAGHFY